MFPVGTQFFLTLLDIGSVDLVMMFVVFQSPSRAQLFWTPWMAACQASLFLTISWSLQKFMSIELVMPSNRLILCHPLLLPQSFPASGSFPISHLLAPGRRRQWHPTPVFLTGKIPWTEEPGELQARKESDTTKPLSTHACTLHRYYNS